MSGLNLGGKPRAAAVAFYGTCFAAPIALLCLICAVLGVHPFGSQSFLADDMRYQYVDLFSWYRRVLLGQTGGAYVANTGLGVGAWGLIGYYLSSPFDLMVVLFDEEHLVDFFWVTCALKLGCMQVSAAWYLRRRFGTPRALAFAMALCFTWSCWTVTQMRNPMWLDALILLPLGAFAVYRLVRTGKWMALAAVVAGAVITCWYMAYMLVIFACLLAVLECVAAGASGMKLTASLVARRAGAFCAAIACALALSAFTFAPSVIAMMGGSSGRAIDSLRMTDFGSLASSFFMGNWTINATPQHYAGTMLLLMGIAFALTRGVAVRVRVCACVIAAFLVASSFLAPLLYVWSGFRMPAGMYCRITFLTVFMGLWMAGCGLKAAPDRAQGRRRWLLAAALIAVVALAEAALGLFAHPENAVITAVAAFAFAFLVGQGAYSPGRHETVSGRRWAPVACGIAVCALTFAELAYSACLDAPALYSGYEQGYHDSYVAESAEQIEQLREADDGLYRAEKTYTRLEFAALNEGMTRDYLGLSTYASSQDIAAVRMLCDLGYSADGFFSMRYSQPILATDSLLGVKYVSADSRPAGFEDAGLMDVSGPAYIDSARFYRNGRALPLGYAVSADAAGFSLDAESNPFERQNALASALAGKRVELYRAADSSLVSDDGFTRTYDVDVPAGSIGYAYAQAPGAVWVGVDGADPVKDNFQWRHAPVALGDAFDQGAVHEVSLAGFGPDPDLPANQEVAQAELPAEASCLFYTLDLQALDQLLSELGDEPCVFQTFEAGNISATCQAGQSGYALVTVPAARGWSASVNGNPVEIESLCDGALMLVPITEGENQIELRYGIPGLVPGCAVSAIALAVMAGGFALARARRKKRTR